MDRINDDTATVDRKFREASAGGVATKVRAIWLNGIQEELIHILEQAGITPSSATLTQVLQALKTIFPTQAALAASDGSDYIGYGSGTLTEALVGIASDIAGLAGDITSGLTGGAPVYASTAAGIAATAEGDYFNVPSAEEGELLILYRHDAGPVATEIGRTPSSSFISDTLQQTEQMVERVALFVDESGNVPVWLDNGDLAASGVEAETITKIREPFAPEVPQASLRVALVQDEAGSVPVWLENGFLGATGVTQDLVDYIFNQGPSNTVTPLASDGRSLYRLKAKLAAIQAGVSAQAKILFVGDSWAERGLIPQLFADNLYAEFGEASTGWISSGSDRTALVAPLNGVTYSTSGFTLLDEDPAATSLDMSAIEATGTTATVGIGNLVAESVSIYSYDGDGTFRYRVDGGAWTAVAGGSTGGTTKTDILGLSDSAHTIDIDLTGNTGTVRIFGFYTQRTATGVEVSKAGNGGSRASGWDAMAMDSAAYLSDINPDAIFVILGTNDSDVGVSQANFKSQMTAFLAEYTNAAPDASIIVIAPPDNGAADKTILEGYASAINEIAESMAMVEVLNIEGMSTDYATMNALGLWGDTKHLNETGAQFIYNAARKYFI